MMDLPPVTSHYEYTLKESSQESSVNQAFECAKAKIQENFFYRDRIKTQAFQAMDRLEGWCSREKASVLMDFIFLLKPQTILEIGVWGGKSLIPMAFATRANQTEGHVYGIDPWSSDESIKGMEGANYEWWNQVDHSGILKGLERSIKQLDLGDYITLIRSTSEAADSTIIGSIDMLHIDGNHSEEASLIDVEKWVPQVRSGGLIIFDDVNWGLLLFRNRLIQEI